MRIPVDVTKKKKSFTSTPGLSRIRASGVLHSESVKNTPESVGEVFGVSWSEECSQPPPFYVYVGPPLMSAIHSPPEKETCVRTGALECESKCHDSSAVDLQTVDWTRLD